MSSFLSSKTRNLIMTGIKAMPRFVIPIKQVTNNVDITNAPSSPGYLEGAMGGIAKTSGVVKHAAVLVPLCTYRDVPSVLFIKRSSRMRNHTSQPAFPGGMIDPEDRGDPVEGALRETEEEIGVHRSYIDVLGLHHDCCTSESKTNRGTIITPVIAMLMEDVSTLDMSLCEAELESVFTVPLSSLCDPSAWCEYKGRPAYIHDLDTGFTLQATPHNTCGSADDSLLRPEITNNNTGDPNALLTAQDGVGEGSSMSGATVGDRRYDDNLVEDNKIRIWGATAWVLNLFLKQVVLPRKDQLHLSSK